METDRSWKKVSQQQCQQQPKRKYVDDKDDETENLAVAEHHSNRAGLFACLGWVFGILFWLYWICFREESKFEWPKEWKIDEWIPDGNWGK